MVEVKQMTYAEMVAALMRGNSETGKQGWSFASALHSTAETEAREAKTAASASITLEGAILARDAVLRILMDHVPSLSDEDDVAIDEKRFGINAYGEPNDNADLAIRTCRCGEHIDGFYEYVDHLKAVFSEP